MNCPHCGAHLQCGPGCDGAYQGHCRLESSPTCPVEICSACAGLYEADEVSRFECKECRVYRRVAALSCLAQAYAGIFGGIPAPFVLRVHIPKEGDLYPDIPMVSVCLPTGGYRESSCGSGAEGLAEAFEKAYDKHQAVIGAICYSHELYHAVRLSEQARRAA